MENEKKDFFSGPDTLVRPRETNLRTVYRSLQNYFTEREKVAMSASIARVCSKIKALENELASVTAQFKADIKRQNAEKDLLVEKITAGWEYRKTACFEYRFYDTGKLEIARRDTGETVEERAMTAEERQIKMKLEDPAGTGDTGLLESPLESEPGVEGAEATPDPPPNSSVVEAKPTSKDALATPLTAALNANTEKIKKWIEEEEGWEAEALPKGYGKNRKEENGTIVMPPVED